MDKLSPEQQRQAREKIAAMTNPVCPYCGKSGTENTNLLDGERKFIGVWCEHQWAESDIEVDPALAPTSPPAPTSNQKSGSSPPLREHWCMWIWHWVGGKWQWPSLFGAGCAMIKFGEYGVGWFLLALAGFAASSKISHWNHPSNPRLQRGIRFTGHILVGMAFIFLTVLTFSIKGRDPWSHLSALLNPAGSMPASPATIARSEHSGHELKLAFVDSPLLTEARRDRIADDLDSFYHYLVNLGLEPATQVRDPFGLEPDRAITMGIAHKNTRDLFFFNPSAPLLIKDASIDDPSEAVDAYAEFVFSVMLPETEYTRNGKAFDDTGSPAWASRKLNRSMTVMTLTGYFVPAFYGKPPLIIDSGSLHKWTLALSEIRKECGKDFTDDVLALVLKSPERSPAGAEEAFDPYFLRRFHFGESAGSDDNRLRADGVLRRVGLLPIERVTKQVRKEPSQGTAPSNGPVTSTGPVTIQPGGVASFGQQGGQTAETIINNPPASPNAAIVSYDFSGGKRISANGGGYQRLVVGPEHDAFQKMLEMEKAQQWQELSIYAEEWIKKTPGWLTSSIFAGEALLRLGQSVKACEYLQSVDDKTQGNNAYDIARTMMRQAGCP